MLSFFAVVIRILSNPFANVIQKQLATEKTSPLFVNFLTYLSLGIICGLFSTNVHLCQFSFQFWVFSFLVGLLGAVGNGFLIKALQYGELSVLGPINAYKSVVGIIGGIFILREYPGFSGCLGIFLIIWGSYFVLGSTPKKFSWHIFKRADIQYRLWATVCAATEAVFIKKIILDSSPNFAFAIWCWFGAVFSFLLVLGDKKIILAEQLSYAGRGFQKYLLLIACIGLMQLSTNYVFQNMEVGYALALFQLSAIVSVLFGFHFFKEGTFYRKLIGATIMVAGSALIFLLDR